MIRRACYMMSYVAFESFNAFSFLSHDSRTSRIFPNFRASFLERSVQYATFMVIIAIGNYVWILRFGADARNFLHILEISKYRIKFVPDHPTSFVRNLWKKESLKKKKRILQKIMETN